MVVKGKKWSQNVQYGLKWSSMVPNGPKWSTRFNLVLVWSKIVQILTKKSSNWVRHNQVSWYSFLLTKKSHMENLTLLTFLSSKRGMVAIAIVGVYKSGDEVWALFL